MLKVTSLFAGIGGIDLGLEATGYYKTTLFSEIDPFCQKILKKHWPNVPIIPDVRDINGKEIETDVLVGGFPCQPFSVAGKRKGKEDERHLWPEMFRIIKEARPSIVIGENVPGIINTQMALGQCVSDLESEGYKVQPVVLPACSVNAPHRRYRVFIIAMVDTDNLRLPQHSGEEKEKQVGWTETPAMSGGSFMANAGRSEWWQQPSRNTESVRRGASEKTQWTAHSDSLGGSGEGAEAVANSVSRNVETGRERQWKVRKGHQGEGISDNVACGSEAAESKNVADSTSSQRHEHEIIKEYGEASSQEILGNGSGIPRECTWWVSEPNVGRVVNGVPNRIQRIKALGNAVVPQLTYVIGMSIIKALREEK